MKRYVILIILCLQAMVCFGQSAVGASTMSFVRSIYDFGTIREQDGSVRYTFEFTNTGTKPFVIENVAVSCGCTTPTYSKAPVMPGKTGKIDVAFDPMGRPGEFLKEIVVTSNNRANRNVLKVKGTVMPRPRTVEDDYPVELTSGVRISELNLNFRYIGQGKSSSMRVGVINTSTKSVSLATKVEPASAYLVVAAPTELCAGCKADMTMTYQFENGADWGMMSNAIYLIVNGVRQSIPISTTAIFVDDFSSVTQQQMEDAPRAKFSAQYYNFGEVKRNTKLIHTFTLTNTGELPLIVRKITPSAGVAVNVKSSISIAPQQSVAIEVTIGGAEPGRLAKSLMLIMNDPNRPMRELRMVATVL